MKYEIPEGYSPSAVRVAQQIYEFAPAAAGILSGEWPHIGFIEEDDVVEVYLAAERPGIDGRFRDEVILGLVGVLEDLGFRVTPEWEDGWSSGATLWHEAWTPSWNNSNILIHDQGPSDREGMRSWTIDIILANADAVTGISGIDRSPWVLVERWIDKHRPAWMRR